MYKMMTGKNKLDYSKWFTITEGNTRASSGYLNVNEPSLSKSEVRRNTFSQRCPTIWNSLSDSVKKFGSVNGFKAAYDAQKKLCTANLKNKTLL